MAPALQRRPFPDKISVQRPDTFTNHAIHRVLLAHSGVSARTTASFRDRKIGAEIYLSSSNRSAKRAFDDLEAQKELIETEFGRLDWQRLNDGKACRVAIHRTDVDVDYAQLMKLYGASPESQGPL